jgi:hypothetical protein
MVRSEMRWEKGFSASEIANGIFRNFGLRPISCLGTGAGVVASFHNLFEHC